MASVKPDIELLAGLTGGGSIGGESGRRIKGEIESIIKEINKNPPSFEITVDQNSIKSFKEDLTKLTDYAKDQAEKIKKAYKGITFPSPTAPKQPKETVLSVGSTAYNNAYTNLSTRLKSVRDNLLKFKDAESATSLEAQDAYKELEKQISAIETLRGELEGGSLKSKEFARSFSEIKKNISDALEKLSLFDGKLRDTRKPEGLGAELLVQNTKAYKKAHDEVEKILKQYRDLETDWSFAGTGEAGAASKTAFENLRNSIAALVSFNDDLEAGKITVEQYATMLPILSKNARDAADAVRLLGTNMTVDEYNKVYSESLEKIDNQILSIRSNLKAWSSAKNGKESASYRGLEEVCDKLEDLRTRFLAGDIALAEFNSELIALSRSSVEYSSRIRIAGESTKSLIDRLKSLADKFGFAFSAAETMQKLIQLTKQMVENVTDIDTAMTELRKVTNETNETYADFLETASVRAKDLGATVKDVVASSADFARLGHGLEDASTLADVAIVYKNVGDGIESITAASESIISTMQAFKVEAKDAITIVDRFNIAGK